MCRCVIINKIINKIYVVCKRQSYKNKRYATKKHGPTCIWFDGYMDYRKEIDPLSNIFWQRKGNKPDRIYPSGETDKEI